jgi:pentatricopeptide repeat protein
MGWYSKLVESDCEPSLLTYNLLISANAKTMNVLGAYESYNKLIKEGLKPDSYTFSSLISLRAARGEWNDAREILCTALSASNKGLVHSWGTSELGTKPSSPMILHNGFMRALLNENRSQELIDDYGQGIEEIVKKILDKNENSLSSSADSSAGSDREMSTSSLLPHKPNEVMPTPNQDTFILLVRAHGHLRDLMGAYKWFKIGVEMLSREGRIHQLDAKLYNSIMWCYIHAGDADSVFSILKEMESQNVEPNLITHALLFKAKNFIGNNNLKQLS